MRTVILGLILVILFFFLRLSGVSLPYHQDEWKNVSASATVEKAGSFFAHPPLTQIMFVTAHEVFGVDYFRLFPLFFALASAVLLYLVVRYRINKKVALWASILYAISFYSILGSLVPDVDGAILPFFFLLSVYAYDRWTDSQKLKWFLLLIGSLVIGFLIKLSFVLVIGTLVVDYIISHWKNMTFRKVALDTVALVGFGFVYVVLLYLIQFIYPAFNIGIMFGHANQFTDNLGRNWIQIIIQGMKAIFYLSPLLLIPILFINKEIFRRTRIFFIYLILGFIFYFILFDFSRGALDKYLMFAIVPLAVIVGTILGDIFSSSNKINKKSWFIFLGLGIIVSAFFLALNFLTHSVVPLYPKEEWFYRVIRFEWNILNPFNGGSGPMGFYVSFLFIVSSFISSLILGIIGFFKKDWRKQIAILLITIGIVYNGVFIEEFLLGKINGSAPEVLKSTISFITKTDSIKKIISYNDIGNHELSMIGKYENRFYAAPNFEADHQKRFSEFNGQYLVVDIPHLYENGFYGKFFGQCQILFETSSGKITGRVYNCPQNQ